MSVQLTLVNPSAAARDGRVNNGGARPGSGRKPGMSITRTVQHRDYARQYTKEAVDKIVQLMRTTKDDWLAFACAKELQDRAYGKAREHLTLEAQDSLQDRYATVEEMRQSIIEEGLPLDRLLAPRLIEGRRD